MNHCGILHGCTIANTALALYLEQITNNSVLERQKASIISQALVRMKQDPRIVEIRRQWRDRRACTHLVPGDVRLFARFHVVVYVWAEDVFTLAELSLLLPSHVGVVAQVCVVLSHDEGHRHLHAICGVAEDRRDRREMKLREIEPGK